MPRSRRIVTRWLLVVAWMALIFLASSDSESGPRGSRLLAPVLHWLIPGMGPRTFGQVVLFIRKAAHFTAFGTLAFLLWWVLAAAHPGVWRAVTAGWALAGSTAFAMSDEVHQLFVPTRTGSPVDVLIDTAGALSVLGCVWVIGRLRRRW